MSTIKMETLSAKIIFQDEKDAINSVPRDLRTSATKDLPKLIELNFDRAIIVYSGKKSSSLFSPEFAQLILWGGEDAIGDVRISIQAEATKDLPGPEFDQTVSFGPGGGRATFINRSLSDDVVCTSNLVTGGRLKNHIPRPTIVVSSARLVNRRADRR